jgi:hypothetical protein
VRTGHGDCTAQGAAALQKACVQPITKLTLLRRTCYIFIEWIAKSWLRPEVTASVAIADGQFE